MGVWLNDCFGGQVDAVDQALCLIAQPPPPESEATPRKGGLGGTGISGRGGGGAGGGGSGGDSGGWWGSGERACGVAQARALVLLVQRCALRLALSHALRYPPAARALGGARSSGDGGGGVGGRGGGGGDRGWLDDWVRALGSLAPAPPAAPVPAASVVPVLAAALLELEVRSALLVYSAASLNFCRNRFLLLNSMGSSRKLCSSPFFHLW